MSEYDEVLEAYHKAVDDIVYIPEMVVPIEVVVPETQKAKPMLCQTCAVAVRVYCPHL